MHFQYTTSQSTRVSFERFLSGMSVHNIMSTHIGLQYVEIGIHTVTLEGILPGMIAVSSDTYFVKTVIHPNHIRSFP